MKIYDCFLFFNEIDLLEIRLELLYPYVDYFIISECDSTFSGLDKPFHFENNKHLFEKYLDKIIHVKNVNSKDYSILNNQYEGNRQKIYNEIVNRFKSTDFSWKSESNWCLDFLHREYVKLGMDKCDDEDLILFSDLDELPNPEIIMKLRSEYDLEKTYVLLEDSFYFYVNVLSQTNWFGSYITKFKNIKTKSVGLFRNDRDSYERIQNGGWHLSFMGGKERVVNKIKSWGHQEYNLPHIIDGVESNMNSLKDLFGRRNRFYSSDIQKYYFESMMKIEMEKYYPKYLIELIEKKFDYLIKK